jgi:hypothetical protein
MIVFVEEFCLAFDEILEKLSRIKCSHPTLKSFFGKLYPPYRHGIKSSSLLVEHFKNPRSDESSLGKFSRSSYDTLDFSHTLGNNDLLVAAAMAEIRYNHHLRVVKVFSEKHTRLLMSSLEDNFKLRVFRYPAEEFSAETIQSVEEWKLKSFLFRVSVAVFVRGTHWRVDVHTMRHVLEYVLAPGPAVEECLAKYSFY